MGVRRIPLRLPRAAPVPLRPGSCSSSSISPCIPCLPPCLPSSLPSRASPLLDGASLLRLRNQAQKKSKSALNPCPGATLQHRLNHLLSTGVKQKNFPRERSCELSAIHENSIHASRNFCALNSLRADHTEYDCRKNFLLKMLQTTSDVVPSVLECRISTL